MLFVKKMKIKKLLITKKKLLKCFALHAMNLKYMKVSLFEITYKKKLTFSRHSNLAVQELSLVGLHMSWPST